MLKRKKNCNSIWAKHVAQQLIMLLEKQQWMPVIAQIILLTIDIARTNRRFLFKFAVHFFVQQKLVFDRCTMFVAGLVNVVSISENANGNQNKQCYY